MPQIVGWYIEDKHMLGLMAVLHAAFNVYCDVDTVLQSNHTDREEAMADIKEQLADHVKEELARKVDRIMSTVMRSAEISPTPVPSLSVSEDAEE